MCVYVRGKNEEKLLFGICVKNSKKLTENCLKRHLLFSQTKHKMFLKKSSAPKKMKFDEICIKNGEWI